MAEFYFCFLAPVLLFIYATQRALYAYVHLLHLLHYSVQEVPG